MILTSGVVNLSTLRDIHEHSSCQSNMAEQYANPSVLPFPPPSKSNKRPNSIPLHFDPNQSTPIPSPPSTLNSQSLDPQHLPLRNTHNPIFGPRTPRTDPINPDITPFSRLTRCIHHLFILALRIPLADIEDRYVCVFGVWVVN